MSVFSIGAISDIGNHRETNQDSVLIKIGEDEDGEFGLFVVADGLGGLTHGEVASQMAVDLLRSWWDSKLPGLLTGGKSIEKIANSLDDELNNINRAILEQAASFRTTMGSTLSLLMIYGTNALIRHIGDSRVYCIKDSLIKLTEDHSLAAQLSNMGSDGDDGRPARSGKNILTKCLGFHETVEYYERKIHFELPVSFLLCTDGFYNFLAEDEIVNALHWDGTSLDFDAQISLENLLDKVKERGATDNASAVAVFRYDIPGRQKTRSFSAFLKKWIRTGSNKKGSI